MSHLCDFSELDRTNGRSGAKLPTQWGLGCHALVAAVFLSVGCATVTVAEAASIDFVDARGSMGTLSGYAGRVVVLDICASWEPACSLNARVLDEVAVAIGDKPIAFVTLLLDDDVIGRAAIASYQDKLSVKHPVVLAGPRVREGKSVLGPSAYVPRVVVLDKRGLVQIDEAGGVLSVEGLVTRVRPLL